MKITFLAAEGCLASGITSLLDMFAIANLWQTSLTGDRQPLFDTEIVSAQGKPVLSSGCIRLLPHRAAEEVDHTDLVLIPPFVPLPDFTTKRIVAMREWVVRQYEIQTPIAALCTGTFLLAETGLLDGRRATTNWQFARKFTRRYPAVRLDIGQILTEDDNLICTGAATASYNLGLMLIGRHGSDELATLCAKALLVDPNRDSQTPYIVHRRQEGHSDGQILQAQRYLEKHFAEDIRIDEVADHVCISSRHFKRRFRQATGFTPIRYLQLVRIETAKHRLESTLASIEEITGQIGYDDCSTFRRLFKQHTGLSPREYRGRFQRVPSGAEPLPSMRP